MILAVDLGTTAVKAVVWSADGPRASARATLVSRRPAPGHVEQDAEDWWSTACEVMASAVDGLDSGDRRRLAAASFSTARQTVVAVDADLRPLGPALVWSDKRVGEAVASKLGWWSEHLPDVARRARWVLGPRDLVVARLTGSIVNDVTVASRSGLYDRADGMVVEAADAWADRLPPVVDSHEIVGAVRAAPAAELGLPAGLPVVVGAGDRACEVLGVGASASQPMVSWGTTANVSVMTGSWPASVAAGLVVSRAAGPGWLIEGGLSGAGSLLDWLAEDTGATTGDLAEEAAAEEPGAHGVLCLPWIDGARAPWWRPDVGVGFRGVGPAHTRAHLARAAYEAVAADVARCLELMTDGADSPGRGSLQLCGGGATGAPWPEIVAGVTGRTVVGRRHTEAASVGAALVGARAVNLSFELDVMNPVASEIRPTRSVVDRYREWRVRADEVVRSVLGPNGAD